MNMSNLKSLFILKKNSTDKIDATFSVIRNK